MEFISAKTIISGYSENENWFGINYNMNIYKGCSHGCIYCDSRSECYGVEDFDRVRAKENALGIIDRELRSKRRKGVVGTGAMSDPYNPLEASYELTRGALEIVNCYGFGISIATKSPLIVRDLDLLMKIAKHSPVLVMMTVTSADDVLCQKVEPGVAPSSERFAAMKALSDAGIPVGVLLMPILPFIEDDVANIEAIIDKANESGASFIYPGVGVTLRQNQREWFYARLDASFPGLRSRYERAFGQAYYCASPNAKQLYERIEEKCRQYGLHYKMHEIISSYKKKYESTQLSLFD